MFRIKMIVLMVVLGVILYTKTDRKVIYLDGLDTIQIDVTDRLEYFVEV